MIRLATRAVRVWREEGFVTMVLRISEHVHRTLIRPHLPQRRATYNGVVTKGARVCDRFCPWESVDKPTYESAIVGALRDRVRAGDRVVVVGGGWGVSGVVAAVEAGQTGQVTVYEGSAEGVENVNDTAALNDVADRVDVKHAVVGAAVSLLGEGNVGTVVSSDELPDCDVLVLDCEGAELDILEELTVRPRLLIVESHRFLDSPPNLVRHRIEALGYEVVSTAPANSDEAAYCKANGIEVLVARLLG